MEISSSRDVTHSSEATIGFSRPRYLGPQAWSYQSLKTPAGHSVPTFNAESRAHSIFGHHGQRPAASAIHLGPEDRGFPFPPNYRIRRDTVGPIDHLLAAIAGISGSRCPMSILLPAPQDPTSPETTAAQGHLALCVGGCAEPDPLDRPASAFDHGGQARRTTIVLSHPAIAALPDRGHPGLHPESPDARNSILLQPPSAALAVLLRAYPQEAPPVHSTHCPRSAIRPSHRADLRQRPAHHLTAAAPAEPRPHLLAVPGV